MHITRWAQPRRRLPPADSSAFFDGPLRAFELFHFVTRDFRVPQHGGHLSLKVVLIGEEQYRIGTRSISLTPGNILFTNAGDEYASAIRNTTEALSFFIPADDAKAALAAAREDDTLLEHAEGARRFPLLPRVPFRASTVLWRSLIALRSALDAEHANGLLDRTREVTDIAIRECLAIAPMTPFAQVVRPSVREELMTRLLRARDRIHDEGGVACPLEALAETACLSPYHFLRRFKEAFGATPGAYARGVRLDRARVAIDRGQNPRLVADRAGYANMEAFTRAIRRLRESR